MGELEVQVREIENQRQTISLLVNEKASLSTSLEALQDADSSECSALEEIGMGHNWSAYLQRRARWKTVSLRNGKRP